MIELNLILIFKVATCYLPFCIRMSNRTKKPVGILLKKDLKNHKVMPKMRMMWDRLMIALCRMIQIPKVTINGSTSVFIVRKERQFELT